MIIHIGQEEVIEITWGLALIKELVFTVVELMYESQYQLDPRRN